MLTFLVFLPLTINNYSQPVYDPPIINQNKGIALVEPYLQDLDSVGASWFYNWGISVDLLDDSRYVPMSYAGLISDNFPVDYDGFVLFLNEPNNPAPFGADVDAVTAAHRYIDFVQARPQAKLVVGNASAWSTQWYRDFLAELLKYPQTPLPRYYGFHGYVEAWITPEHLSNYWDGTNYYLQSISGFQPEIWVTEFAETTGDTESLTDLMDVIQSKEYITRFAYFTNRYDPTQPYIPGGWHDFNLIEDDGTLSPVGLIYAQR